MRNHLSKQRLAKAKDLPRNWGMATAIDGFKLTSNITPKLRGRSHDDIWELLHYELHLPTKYEIIDMCNFKCNSCGKTHSQGLATNFVQAMTSILSVN
jgi:hypothetical protein